MKERSPTRDYLYNDILDDPIKAGFGMWKFFSTKIIPPKKFIFIFFLSYLYNILMFYVEWDVLLDMRLCRICRQGNNGKYLTKSYNWLNKQISSNSWLYRITSLTENFILYKIFRF